MQILTFLFFLPEASNNSLNEKTWDAVKYGIDFSGSALQGPGFDTQVKKFRLISNNIQKLNGHTLFSKNYFSFTLSIFRLNKNWKQNLAPMEWFENLWHLCLVISWWCGNKRDQQVESCHWPAGSSAHLPQCTQHSLWVFLFKICSHMDFGQHRCWERWSSAHLKNFTPLLLQLSDPVVDRRVRKYQVLVLKHHQVTFYCYFTW